MRIALSWLQEFVGLRESPDELRAVMDDLGLVVEGIEHVGAGLESVVVARIDEISPIAGADRIRRIKVDAGHGPLEIVCGAMNFSVGDHVPLAPVGAVLPGGFEIAERRMKGVVSNGMLCSARELGLSDDHDGLMVLDHLIAPVVGQPLLEALDVVPDVIFDISVEGNRPDAWSVAGVARDLATRLGRPLSAPTLAQPNAGAVTSSVAQAAIEDEELCGRLTVSVLRKVVVGPSPAWIRRRVESAGMRSISNVVDASNLVMIELGQPTHPYDLAHVAGQTIRVRRARTGERLETLDGVVRELAKGGRGLGDTGVDCVIVDGDDVVIGLAGIMGGASSEISQSTTEVLLESAFFDPMTIARSAKHHGLRSEASNRFERGVDPQLALRAVARFVAILRESVPDLEWLDEPIDLWGVVPELPSITLRDGDVERSLGVAIDEDVVVEILEGLGFSLRRSGRDLIVVPSTARLDVRSGAAGRADVIEEIARLYSYRRLPRHTPTWPQPGGLSERQVLRRLVRDVVVDLGATEAWTPSLGSDVDFELLHPQLRRVRITNPLTAEESVLRATMITGLVRAWVRNVERGTGDVVLSEMGVVFTHPDDAKIPRPSKGGVQGAVTLILPNENERLTVILGRELDDALSAVALWSVLAGRLGLADVVVRSLKEPVPGFHQTRCAELTDRSTGALIGHVGEVDDELIATLSGALGGRRLGLVDIDLDALADQDRVIRRSQVAQIPSRYPSAVVDLALVAPESLNAQDLANALRTASPLVESVQLFDVYRGATLEHGTRSLAYRVRFSSPDRTLSESEVSKVREHLIEVAQSTGANLR
ncbi:MAG: phenylalanine--tRNA ligase subunit beta [Acidimicrobiaceae bacterium]|nr:phenylalanine--tRNA ligase subunit beta [Acidimicrobiaceae bacterium]